MESVPHSSADAGAEPGIGRRQLMRAGAWAAPVVLLAAPVPAFAASAGPFQLLQNGPEFFFGWSATGQRTGIVGTTMVAVVFDAAAATITDITLTVQLTTTGLAALIDPAPAQFLTNPGDFWSSSTATVVNADTVSYTLTWSETLNTATLLNTGVVEFAFLSQSGIDLTPLIPIGWTMTASATNATSVTVSGSMITAGEFDSRIKIPSP